MVRVYSAWTAGGAESDIDAIKRAMNGEPQLPPKCSEGAATRVRIAAGLVDIVFATADRMSRLHSMARRIGHWIGHSSPVRSASPL